MLSTFLNTPPPPPPPNVPTLEESAKGTTDAPKTVREQLERHRANAACASCHRDHRPARVCARELRRGRSVARPRTADGAAIDAAGVLADGTKVDGPVALRAGHPGSAGAPSSTAVTERMMTYALGRGLEPADMPVVRRIVLRTPRRTITAPASIVTGIVDSVPFQNADPAWTARPINSRSSSKAKE